jgi:hypothetical protein
LKQNFAIHFAAKGPTLGVAEHSSLFEDEAKGLKVILIDD